ncbi:Polyamine oxidase [Thalictrum thalictroides]|uniref:Polyamine oxidase n=1 Tax=Thalictrum thalictroides TaxID=46969 RepID=A0A7J6VI19_THATH|nr:Polyamine oxidase [Thalictrum thalictroides]
MHKTQFAGLSVEIGANWVEGVNGEQMNPIWPMVNKLKLKTYLSDYENLTSNTYKQVGGLYDAATSKAAFEASEELSDFTTKTSTSLTATKQEDISILAAQRLKHQYAVCRTQNL